MPWKRRPLAPEHQRTAGGECWFPCARERPVPAVDGALSGQSEPAWKRETDARRRTSPRAMLALPAATHHGDDLLGARRVCGKVATPIRRSAARLTPRPDHGQMTRSG